MTLRPSGPAAAPTVVLAARAPARLPLRARRRDAPAPRGARAVRRPSTTSTASTTRRTRSRRRCRRGPCSPSTRSSCRPRRTSPARSPGPRSPRRSAPGSSTPTDTDLVVLSAALVGAITWNLITWRLGIPSSSSHALIGGLLGATIIAAGIGRRRSGTASFWKVLVPLVASPILGITIGLPVHGRPAQRLPGRAPATAERPVPPAPGRLGGLHGLQPRLERRPEDDGHHDPGPVRRPG